MRLLFLVAIGVAAYLVWKLYLRQLLGQGVAGRIKIGLVSLGFVFLALAVSGRAPAVFALVGALMTQALRFGPLIARLAPGLAKRFGVGNPFARSTTSPGISQVRTTTILMTLEHANGRMDGDVLVGEFSGRRLSDLVAGEIVALHGYCRTHDTEALRLLEAYVARERTDEFENAGGPGGGPAGTAGADSNGRDDGRMSIAEATEVLGLPPDFDRQEVVAAHRKLMGRLHPDKGGSDYLASKVNAARTVLLETLEQAS